MSSFMYNDIVYEPEKMTTKDINRLKHKKLKLENDISILKHHYEQELYHREMIAKYNNNSILYEIPLIEARIVLDNNLTLDEYNQIKNKLDVLDVITGYDEQTGVFSVEEGTGDELTIIEPVRANIETINASIVALKQELQLVIKIRDEYKKYMFSEDHKKRMQEKLIEKVHNTSVQKLLDTMTEEESEKVLASINKNVNCYSNVYKGIDSIIKEYKKYTSLYGEFCLYEFKQHCDKYMMKFVLKDSPIAFEKWFHS